MSPRAMAVATTPIFMCVTSAGKLRRSRKIGYFAMAALAVALPGVDPVTTAMEMVPPMYGM